ncbi:hypothetical protein M885DRAFT_559836 [Pelagophyceae sp. CCMP2097]|nr:hypothetical protein M885DRAFT_559836 [Pelagophyceae sp. CCMP2097]
MDWTALPEAVQSVACYLCARPSSVATIQADDDADDADDDAASSSRCRARTRVASRQSTQTDDDDDDDDDEAARGGVLISRAAAALARGRTAAAAWSSARAVCRRWRDAWANARGPTLEVDGGAASARRLRRGAAGPAFEVCRVVDWESFPDDALRLLRRQASTLWLETAGPLDDARALRLAAILADAAGGTNDATVLIAAARLTCDGAAAAALGCACAPFRHVGVRVLRGVRRTAEYVATASGGELKAGASPLGALVSALLEARAEARAVLGPDSSREVCGAAAVRCAAARRVEVGIARHGLAQDELDVIGAVAPRVSHLALSACPRRTRPKFVWQIAAPTCCALRRAQITDVTLRVSELALLVALPFLDALRCGGPSLSGAFYVDAARPREPQLRRVTHALWPSPALRRGLRSLRLDLGGTPAKLADELLVAVANGLHAGLLTKLDVRGVCVTPKAAAALRSVVARDGANLASLAIKGTIKSADRARVGAEMLRLIRGRAAPLVQASLPLRLDEDDDDSDDEDDDVDDDADDGFAALRDCSLLREELDALLARDGAVAFDGRDVTLAAPRSRAAAAHWPPGRETRRRGPY